MIKSSLIAASAGSGKTYTVTTELLKLLVHSYSNMNDILVTTFTKKAAQEIFERLITRILSCLESQEQLELLKNDINFPTLTNEILRERLFKLVKNQNNLKIQTIDSFLVSIAQNFPIELSLPIGWKVADTWESEILDKKIILETLERIGTKNLLLILPLIFKNKFSSKTFSAIEDELHSLFDDIVLYDKEAWQLSTVNHFNDDKTYDLALFYDKLHSLVESGEVKEQLRKSLFKMITLAEENEWEELLATTIIQRARTGDYTFYKKQLPEPIVEIVNSLMNHATYKLARSIHEQSIGLGAIYSTFDVCRQELQRQNGLLTFNDITQLLSKSQIKNKLHEIYYKLDSKINFIFIDEFQDTSASQWTILNPLVEELLQDNSQSRIFTAVGDSKQAIYGWRGGLHDIFGFIKETCTQLNEKILAKSYRSQKHIIDFVNKVFTDPVLPQRYSEVREIWKNNFNTHVAHSTSRTGRIDISKIEYIKDSSLLLQRRLERIKEYVLDELAHNPNSKIGILTRTNTQALSIEKYLKDNNIEASSISSNQLSSFLEIQLVISFLTLALHPGDNLSYTHLKLYLDTLVGSRNQKQLSLYLLEKINVEGLRASIQSVFDLIIEKKYHLRCDIDYVLNLAKGLERKQGNQISHFIKILYSSKTQDAALSKINILTIHKSKGLEFDHVIIPFTGGSFFREDDFYLLKEQDSPFESPYSIVKNCKTAARPFIPQVDTLTEQARLTKISEALCLSYVAITRAKESLSIIIDSNTNEDKASLASLLLNTLGLEIGKENTTLFSLGEYSQGKKLVQDNKKAEKLITSPAPAPKKSAHSASDMDSHLPLLSPSMLGEDTKNTSALYSEANDASILGTEVHAILAKIKKEYKSQKDLIEDVESILEVEKSSTQCIKIIKTFMGTNAAQEIFLKKAGVNRVDITEFSISEIHDQALYVGRIDRLHFYMEDEKITRIEVFDFKLGSISQEKYKIQLQTYKELVALRFKVSTDVIETSLIPLI